MCHCSADDVASDFTLRGVIVQSIHGDRCVTDFFFLLRQCLVWKPVIPPRQGDGEELFTMQRSKHHESHHSVKEAINLVWGKHWVTELCE